MHSMSSKLSLKAGAGRPIPDNGKPDIWQRIQNRHQPIYPLFGGQPPHIEQQPFVTFTLSQTLTPANVSVARIKKFAVDAPCPDLDMAFEGV